MLDGKECTHISYLIESLKFNFFLGSVRAPRGLPFYIPKNALEPNQKNADTCLGKETQWVSFHAVAAQKGTHASFSDSNPKLDEPVGS